MGDDRMPTVDATDPVSEPVQQPVADPVAEPADEAAAPSAIQPVAASRAARRAQREERRRHPIMPPIATERRVTLVLATVLFAVLLAIATSADHALGAAAVAWGGVALAWGWPELLGSSSRFGSSFAIGVAGVLAPVVVASTPDEPYLRNVPVVVALAMLVMFMHQLLRKDGRPRLTQSVAVSAAGIAIATIGAAYVPLGRTSGGPDVVLIAGIALAVSSLADLGAPIARLRPWMVPLAVLLGAGAGGVAGLVLTDVGGLVGLLLGAVAAGLAHVTRRALCTLPPIRGVRGQVTAAAASVLVTAVPVYLLARILVG
ncbi:hypothetical protein [Knoellia sp. Soil729]|uniref:hypothetical protein n=1 Tax=Knoellia sp. Soil729 TaxID=1736394 RepID=UPI0006FEEE86|nr:hypothetical protein [Knoellia sp. Soil729]KRE44104.1 hypothetical protein ASG74_04600 [Knoellia sp. Soil729]